ncbi:S12A8 protein, partial [Polypterus senegalus]
MDPTGLSPRTTIPGMPCGHPCGSLRLGLMPSGIMEEGSENNTQPWWKIQLFVWEPVLFGTWDGVFTTCMINIFGVVLFLRTGWLVGNTGILLGMFLVSLVVLVALVTVVSGIGVCERCSIGNGGVYSMISTVLGERVGATIGLLYIFGQCVAGAMYITGFAESIADLLSLRNIWAVRGISIGVLLGLLGINLAGVKWIIRLQLLLLALLAISTLDFVVGTFTHLDTDGIEAGFQCGDLEGVGSGRWKLELTNRLCLDVVSEGARVREASYSVTVGVARQDSLAVSLAEDLEKFYCGQNTQGRQRHNTHRKIARDLTFFQVCNGKKEDKTGQQHQRKFHVRHGRHSGWRQGDYTDRERTPDEETYNEVCAANVDNLFKITHLYHAHTSEKIIRSSAGCRRISEDSVALLCGQTDNEKDFRITGAARDTGSTTKDSRKVTSVSSCL